ncbi:hypothetical protein KGF56_003049 [Candida oxycetoniae]|uniref:Uncharacterized protein n=1 Tax=Candida oxycetoniae TaxID=497107 RepID=A0AAI9SWH2_9ASCO|nr:uncharacterized protein KGF56_003049 [Candida oxycetoniae]KAI3404149.2 hypothetical protein KGF56_003049 [Candida oxycetoniae]
MNSHNYGLEEEEFDDTITETPAKAITPKRKLGGSEPINYTKFRTTSDNLTEKSPILQKVDQEIKQAESILINERSHYGRRDFGERSPPNLKFDRSILPTEGSPVSSRRQSSTLSQRPSTPIQASEIKNNKNGTSSDLIETPLLVKLKSVRNTPSQEPLIKEKSVQSETTNTNVQSLRKRFTRKSPEKFPEISKPPKRNIFQVNEDGNQSGVKSSNDLKKSLMDRVNNTLESLYRKEEQDSPVKEDSMSQDMGGLEDLDEFDLLARPSVKEPDMIRHKRSRKDKSEEVDITLPTIEKSASVQNKRLKTEESSLSHNSLGSSTPIGRGGREGEGREGEGREGEGREGEGEGREGREGEGEGREGEGGGREGREYKKIKSPDMNISSMATWWSSSQWSKLEKVVRSQSIKREEAINSSLLMKELGCSSKKELQNRYDFLSQYNNDANTRFYYNKLKERDY